jgi:cobalt-zinc-cadmium efflux system membrane fusion protein
VSADGAEAPAAGIAGELQIPESYLALMDIAVEQVSVGELGAEIQAPGTVVAATNGQATVTARAAGTLARVNRKLGDEVKAGEVLAIVASGEAAAMAAEGAIAQSRLDLARSVLQREQSLYNQKVTPRQDLDAAEAAFAAAEAEATRAQVAAAAAGVSSDGRTLAVISPIAGRVTSASAIVGSFVAPATQLFRVADPRFVLVEAAVPAAEARRIKAGDTALVAAGSGDSLRATVVSVTPTISEETRSATATLSLAEGQALPAPGEFVQVVIKTGAGSETGIVVPDEAVQKVDGHDAAFVRTGNGFRVVPVVVGVRSGHRAAILSGLKAGDTVATRNAFLLKAEVAKGAEDEE